MLNRLCLATVFTIGLWMGSIVIPESASAAFTFLKAIDNQQTHSSSPKEKYIILAGRRGGGSARSRGARPSGGKKANRNVNKNVNRKANKNVNRNASKNVNRNVNKNVNRNVNVHVKNRSYGWRGARWGAVAFGVTMGAIITVAANTPPYPPDPSLCWTWTNASLTQGYWYYCSGP